MSFGAIEITKEIEIASFNTPIEARVAVSFLQANAINARLADAHMKSMLGSLDFGGYRVMAPEEDAAQARLLLNAAGNERTTKG